MTTQSPFFPSFEELPGTLPVFPLENVIVMPGAELPLNIFEPRYLNMIEDALKTHHMFGMIQPDTTSTEDPRPLQVTGCAGRITAYSETTDGRILLSLTGMIRFDVLEEIPTIKGYRVVVPDWTRYASDLAQSSDKELDNRPYLTSVLEHYLKSQNMETDWDALKRVPDMHLVHAMATLLPIGPAEKQAILEAEEPRQRADLFLAALEISLQQDSGMSRH
ncbi:MAG: peptidase S16 [Gammaproteobacteria bacterium]|nr:peptidase S16 [Gammaproteobacteria bacterium]